MEIYIKFINNILNHYPGSCECNLYLLNVGSLVILGTYLRTYVRTYLRSYLRTYLRTYLPTYLRACVCTYLRSYLRTYLRACGCVHNGEVLDFYPNLKLTAHLKIDHPRILLVFSNKKYIFYTKFCQKI